MNPELYNKLLLKYPNLFKEALGDSKLSISLFGIETNGPGWDKLIQTLCEGIDYHVKHNKCRPVTITQIKEKYGGLRFYYYGGDDIVDGMVRMAELVSEYTCEQCGKQGKIRTDAWLKTLCDEHAEME